MNVDKARERMAEGYTPTALYIPLQPGVRPEHPDVQRLLAEIAAVKPLPPKLTVREQLAGALFSAFHKAVNGANVKLPDFDPSTTSSYLAEADAAIAFFRTVLVQVRNDNLQLIGDGDPAAVRVHNDAVEQLTIDLGKAFSK